MAMKLRIGHLSTFYHTAILLLAKGIVPGRLGCEVSWHLMGTGPAIMQAFRRGELDLAYIGLPPALIGMEQGINVICIAGGHMEGTVMAGKPWAKAASEAGGPGRVFEQFRGRTIGVPGKGSIHDVILRDCLDRFGLGKAVTVRNFAWADLALEAVVRDEVAAAIGTPALAAAIRRFAGGTVLLPPSDLWPDNPSYGIVANREFVERNRDLVENFVVLHEEAATLLREKPREAAAAIAEFVGIIDPELVRDALSISPRYCACLTEAYVASTVRFVPVLKKLGYIKYDITEERIFYRDIIRNVHPENDHYRAGIANEEE